MVGSRRSRGGNVGTKEESKDGSEKVEEEEGCGDASSEEDKEQQVKVGRKRRKQKAKEKSGTTTEAVAEGMKPRSQLTLKPGNGARRHVLLYGLNTCIYI